MKNPQAVIRQLVDFSLFRTGSAPGGSVRFPMRWSTPEREVFPGRISRRAEIREKTNASEQKQNIAFGWSGAAESAPLFFIQDKRKLPEKNPAASSTV